ncbi:MAG: MFS transporter [Limibacillus sp.]|jgi:ACDE family multidrug resistance protein
MALNVRHPVWMHSLGAPGARSFALLAALDAMTRAILATVLPLQVLAVMGSPADLSKLYLIVSLLGLIGNFFIVPLTGLISRRWTYTLGMVCLLIAAPSIASASLMGVAAGMLLRVFGTAVGAVCLNLYVLDHIRGRELNDMEPLRLLFAASAWTIGPWLGVTLWKIEPLLPFVLSGAGALSLLAYFWYLRVGDNPIIVKARHKPANPFGAILPFFKRPPLRHAWMIATGRSIWWVSFFVYLPVFGVQSGLSAETCALLVSAGNGLLFATPLLVRLGRRWGVRRNLVFAFLTSGAVTSAAGLSAWIDPYLTVLLLLACAPFVVLLDIYGNVPFLRQVKPSERLPMTPVFITYRDGSEVAAPAFAWLVLLAFPLPVYFLALGGGLACISFLARTLPRRL